MTFRGKVCLALSLLLGITGSARAANNIFFSTVGTVGGGASVGNPALNFVGSGGSSSLYIWVTDQTLVDKGLAVNLAVTGSSGVAALTGAQAFNFNLNTTFNGGDLGDSGSDRWQSVSNFGSGNANVTPTLIQNLNAVTAESGGGIRAANNGPASGLGKLDLGYDVLAHAFLYGRLDFNRIGTGSTTIALQASPLGIAQGATDISGSFTYGTATIVVAAVPEPTAFTLLGTGCVGFGMIRRRWRRRMVA